MATRSGRHPVFSRMYARMAAKLEAQGVAEHRRELLAGVEGRVIEVGAGNGLNFAHYPSTVTEVVAVEPEPYLRARADEAAAQADVPVRVVAGRADALPAEDGSFDAGVASLVLCSVPEQHTALAELFRVIRPGGELRFYEHVLATDERWARRQHRLAPIWGWFSGGCQPNRDTGAAITAAGFEVQDRRDFLFAPCFVVKPAAPHILGRAIRPVAR